MESKVHPLVALGVILVLLCAIGLIYHYRARPMSRKQAESMIQKIEANEPDPLETYNKMPEIRRMKAKQAAEKGTKAQTAPAPAQGGHHH